MIIFFLYFICINITQHDHNIHIYMKYYGIIFERQTKYIMAMMCIVVEEETNPNQLKQWKKKCILYIDIYTYIYEIYGTKKTKRQFSQWI